MLELNEEFLHMTLYRDSKNEIASKVIPIKGNLDNELDTMVQIHKDPNEGLF